jgi:hypothetical protein
VTSALAVLASIGDLKRQSELTFAMGRHALVDLANIFKTPPLEGRNRLSTEVFLQLQRLISTTHIPLQAELLSEDKLKNLTEMYEPFANALGHHFLMAFRFGYQSLTRMTIAKRHRGEHSQSFCGFGSISGRTRRT